MSKIQLKLEDDYDFCLIGISCHHKDYRLCYELNKSLEIDLEKDNDLVINKVSETVAFSLSLHLDEENHLEYYLIANKGTQGYLINEQKSADFFMMLKGVVNDNDVQQLITTLKSMNIILAAFEIQPESLKSKANLLF